MARVALLVGGPGPEHDASLASGDEILRGLREGAHVVRPVWISHDARWTIGVADDSLDAVVGRPDGVATSEALSALRASGETAFLAMHGRFGVGGDLQRLLEAAGVAYTGSGPAACEMCLDRDLATLAVARLGGRCAKHEIVAGTRFPAWGIGKGIGYPCVAKPVGSRSRAGTTIVESEESLREAVTRAQADDPTGRCMVEEFIPGRVLSCSALRRGGKLETLPLVLAVGALDGPSRSDSGVPRGSAPADVPRASVEEIERITRALFEGLDLRGLARVDVVLPIDGGRPVFLEVRALPELAPPGSVATAARAAGVSRAELVAAVLADAWSLLPTRRRR